MCLACRWFQIQSPASVVERVSGVKSWERPLPDEPLPKDVGTIIRAPRKISRENGSVVHWELGWAGLKLPRPTFAIFKQNETFVQRALVVFFLDVPGFCHLVGY